MLKCKQDEKKKHNTKCISGTNYYGDFETSVLEI